MLELLKALRELEQVETKMADLYDWLGDQFEDDADAASLFRHLQMEEISHHNILRYESRIVRANPKAFRDIVLDTEMLNRTLDAIDNFRLANPRPTLQQALQASLAFEAGAAELYYITVFQESARSFADFVKNLHVGSRTHFDNLHKFATRRKIDLPAGIAPPEVTIPSIPSPVIPTQASPNAAAGRRRP